MDERSISADTRKGLRKRGFYVTKHEDMSTIGVPDMTIDGNGRTLWVEDKYIAVNELRNSIGARTLVVPKRRPQMVSMVQHTIHSLAEYWLYQNVNGEVFVGWLNPIEVYQAYVSNNRTQVLIRDILPRSQWVETFALPRNSL